MSELASADLDAVVIGAGIAGLTAAWRLRHRRVAVLERATRVGGRVWSEPRGDRWMNLGAHLFSGAASPTGRLLDEIGVPALSVPGQLAAFAMEGRLLTDGRANTYPLRIPFSASDRLALARVGARLRVAALRYGRAAAERRGDRPGDRQLRLLDFMSDETFSEFTGPLPPRVDAMLRPTVMRSSGTPEQVTAGAGVGCLHPVWSRQRGERVRNVVGGSSQLTDALARDLGSRIVLDARVTRVRAGADAVAVEYETAGAPRSLRARHCVLATPAAESARLGGDLAADTRAALGKIRYGSYVSGAFLTDESQPAPWDGCYAITAADRAFNVFCNSTSIARASKAERRPGSSVTVLSPATLADELMALDDDAVIDAYLRDIDAIFPGFSATVVESRVGRFPAAVPYCFPGRTALQPALTRRHRRLHLAGDYLGTFYTDTAVDSADRVADLVLGDLERAAPARPAAVESTG